MRATVVFLLVLGNLAITHALPMPQPTAWTCKEAPELTNAVQIDAGQGQVVAADSRGNAFILIGNTWNRLPSANLKHVSVGPAGIWAVNEADEIYKLVAGHWAQVEGRLKQVDAGGNAFLVGVNREDGVYCLRSGDTVGFNGVGGVTWTRKPGSLKFYSCGPNGCWGANMGNMVFYMKQTNPTNCTHSEWQNIPGVELIMIEVGSDGSVFGVSASGEVYTRGGITTSQPQGTIWISIPMCLAMKHITYDLGRLWVLSRSGVMLTCTNNASAS